MQRLLGSDQGGGVRAGEAGRSGERDEGLEPFEEGEGEGSDAGSQMGAGSDASSSLSYDFGGEIAADGSSHAPSLATGVPATALVGTGSSGATGVGGAGSSSGGVVGGGSGTMRKGSCRLPSAHTCGRSLLLPRYRSAAEMRHQLRVVLAWAREGMGLA